MNDAYNMPALNAALRGTPFFERLQHFATIPSTNAYAIEQAQAGAPGGSVYFADEQTAGRGRGGHAWHSEPDAGLYVSVLLRPRLSPDAALLLSLATGLAARSAIKDVCGLDADIRWPNDLLLNQKKCCGILVETAMGGEAPGNIGSHSLRHAVFGVGINVNHAAFPGELGGLATSLRIESGRVLRRGDLLVMLLKALHHEIEALEAGLAASLLARFEQASSWVRGKRVSVQDAGADPADRYTGVTAGLDARGFLLVETAVEARTVISGGVRELP